MSKQIHVEILKRKCCKTGKTGKLFFNMILYEVDPSGEKNLRTTL